MHGGRAAVDKALPMPNHTDRIPRIPDPSVRLALELPDGRRHTLPRCEPLLIGSAPDCTLRLSDPFVSARHARIRFCKAGFRIEDLGSTNGTQIDGVSVGRAVLEPGMSVGIGGVRISVTRIDRKVDELRARRTRGELLPGSTTQLPGTPPPGHTMIGRSRGIQRVRRMLEKFAQLALPVLIHGETGTGKELAAKTLHDFGPRFGEPFVAVNCGAIPEQLFESELFGHAKGAFTGAHRDHEGAFVRAGAGTLFLDEIGELPLSAQAKLLRVLETRMVAPLGHATELAIACRVVAATHRDLAEMVRAGTFREDLYHRLGVLELELPPLRGRRRDISILLEHFVVEAARELGRELVVSRDAVEAALDFPWPGNVRSLRNAVMRAAALSEGPITSAQLIPTLEQSPASNFIRVPRGDYASMTKALIRHVVAEEGSIRRAARVLNLPRSTLGSWISAARSREDGEDADEHDGSPAAITAHPSPALAVSA
jgi:DNA-binding NtrC family response regulator